MNHDEILSWSHNENIKSLALKHQSLLSRQNNPHYCCKTKRFHIPPFSCDFFSVQHNIIILLLLYYYILLFWLVLIMVWSTKKFQVGPCSTFEHDTYDRRHELFFFHSWRVFDILIMIWCLMEYGLRDYGWYSLTYV